MNRLILSAAASALLLGACATTAAQERPPHLPADLSPGSVAAADEFIWMEEVQGERALAFVEQSNARARHRLEGDPRFEPFRRDAYAILSAQDRIPTPRFQGEGLANFWQDDQHPKGIWRRTTLESYRSGSTRWETILDIDALARAEGRDWVWKGAQCLAPDERYCLVNLSNGGQDAVEVREFDTQTGRFVEGGFRLPEGKHRVTWLDADTLLVATDFGQGTLTESGYPYIVRALSRGQSLDQASEIYRGQQGDGGYGVSPSVYRGPGGAVEAVIITRPLDTFRSERWQYVDGRTVQLNLPERVSIHGTMGDQLIFTAEQDWSLQGQSVPTGALAAVNLAQLRGDPRAVASGASPVIFEPNARQSVNGVAITGRNVVASVLDNVSGGLIRFSSGADGWTAQPLPTPANAAVSITDSSRGHENLFYYVQGFLTPSTLSLADVASARSETLRESPVRFDASTHVVEQHSVASTDGTEIPYFLVRPRDQAADGTAPTILFGYGGFNIPMLPGYAGQLGKLWLERGGSYVVANIRGGGEFGPGWHQAALRENRQRSFDDFAAVARDLIARGVTSPRHLGIYGRSNGGVLTSVAITQNPDLFNAAVIESPLIDMMRYPDMPAGASWIGEYGDPRIAEDAAFIARYSAYQQLRPDVEYPVVYITTNTLDDRVHPGHARKFAARLEAQGHDHLYFEDTSGGHSYDADPAANARRWARHYVYFAQQLMDD
ncbi:prolyl oligopeptidase family serine peptidase [Brevundimonas sp.]|uniref:prolyl oligopeptidase family serine peptidase n=1 Tax=Brevundimonas sp. TaxID=1871086 RepID=UPI001D70C5B2|nr:prolyl oligopeptidase family serine peptidase [Brevundimonas sp.]MBA4000451.1 S9 family peptidase [Brevundimonas sp.]